MDLVIDKTKRHKKKVKNIDKNIPKMDIEHIVSCKGKLTDKLYGVWHRW